MIAATLLAGLLTASPVVFGAQGPGEGGTAVGLGGRMFLLTDGFLPIPTFAFDLAHGLGPDTDLVLHASTVVVFSLAEAGARVRLGDLGPLHMAALAELAGALLVGRDADNSTTGKAAAALIPGLTATFEAEALVTLGLDVPVILRQAGPFNHQVMVRPSVTLESHDGGPYLRVELYAPHITPTVAIGYLW